VRLFFSERQKRQLLQAEKKQSTATRSVAKALGKSSFQDRLLAINFKKFGASKASAFASAEKTNHSYAKRCEVFN
jgi:hypothetical protein